MVVEDIRSRPPEPGGAARFEIVVDTNIWLDMLVFDNPGARRLAELLDPPAPSMLSVHALSSDEMRAELADVIRRAHFKLDDPAREALLARYDRIVVRAPVASDCRLACRDPDDRKFLDLAVARRTAWLLSRDRALLAARKPAWKRFSLRIGLVDDFYAWIDAGAGAPPG